MLLEDNDNIINNLPRLAWACRRGMLELDVLLGNFLKEAYPCLALENKHLFVRLLESSDPELYDWLLGQTEPKDPELHWISTAVRDHARSRI